MHSIITGQRAACMDSWIYGQLLLSLLQVKQAWDFAYQQLTAPSDASDSVLERIIRVDTVLTDRPRPLDPEVPEQREQEMRDEMHHKSQRSRKEHKHRDRDSKHRDRDRDKDSRHKDKKRRRERSVEFTDPDPDVEPQRTKSRRSGSRGEDRRHKENSHKHRKSDRRRFSRDVSPADLRQSKHIRFSE